MKTTPPLPRSPLLSENSSSTRPLLQHQGWQADRPSASFDPQASLITVTVASTGGTAGVRFGPRSHGGLFEVGSSIRKHTITPAVHRLSHINGQLLEKFVPVLDQACPNQHLSATIASLPTPFRLSFERKFDAATTHPAALRIFIDGGARSKDKLAAVGFQIRRGPFDNHCAVYPDENDGVLVAKGEYKVDFPAKDETDNVECELSAAGIALYRLFELGEARADLYTDCVAVIQAAMGKGSAIRPHLALLGLRLRAAREHASPGGGR